MGLSLNPFSSLLNSAKSVASSVSNFGGGFGGVSGIGDNGPFSGDFGGGFGGGTSFGLDGITKTVNRLAGGVGRHRRGASGCHRFWLLPSSLRLPWRGPGLQARPAPASSC